MIAKQKNELYQSQAKELQTKQRVEKLIKGFPEDESIPWEEALKVSQKLYKDILISKEEVNIDTPNPKKENLASTIDDISKQARGNTKLHVEVMTKDKTKKTTKDNAEEEKEDNIEKKLEDRKDIEQ